MTITIEDIAKRFNKTISYTNGINEVMIDRVYDKYVKAGAMTFNEYQIEREAKIQTYLYIRRLIE